MIFIIAAGIVAVLVVGFIIIELDVRGHRSARYLVPIFLSAILIAVLVAVNRGFKSLSNYFTADFAFGFIVGAVFLAAMYGLACWIDPASRPRGTRPAADE